MTADQHRGKSFHLGSIKNRLVVALLWVTLGSSASFSTTSDQASDPASKLILAQLTNQGKAPPEKNRTVSTTPWLRTQGSVEHLRIDPNGRFAAFTSAGGIGLRLLDLRSRRIHEIDPGQVGPSFFFSPDGFRLFYRILSKDSRGSVTSTIKAYDSALLKSIILEEAPGGSGFLTFDPRDLRFHYMTSSGVRSRRIFFPDERLARWQVEQWQGSGKWLATQNGILRITEGNFALERLADDKEPTRSFNISPDGSMIAWATASGKIYTAKEGGKSTFFDFGFDPRWHPSKPLLVYAGARRVGRQSISFDLKIGDLSTRRRFLTASQYSSERWPSWHPEGNRLIYTIDGTTDLWVLKIKPLDW